MNMTASELYQPLNTELKVVAPVTEPAMHAIPGQETLLNTAPPKSVQDAADIFSITYNYRNELHYTRVVKVGNNDAAFYKVALSSQVCGNQCLCWLKKEPQGWQMLLGQPIEAGLMTAITEAIESL
jgi:hypothetical protein